MRGYVRACVRACACVRVRVRVRVRSTTPPPVRCVLFAAAQAACTPQLADCHVCVPAGRVCTRVRWLCGRRLAQVNYVVPLFNFGSALTLPTHAGPGSFRISAGIDMM